MVTLIPKGATSVLTIQRCPRCIFGAVIHAKDREADLAADGCDVEDMAGSLAYEARKHSAGDVEQSEKIGFKLWRISVRRSPPRQHR